MFFIFKYSDSIILKLPNESSGKSFYGNHIIEPVLCKNITKKEHQIVKNKQDTANIMNRNRALEFYKIGGIGKLDIQTGNNKNEAKQCIYQMPEPDPDRIQVKPFSLMIHGNEDYFFMRRKA